MIEAKIFGKLKQHKIETYIRAGEQTYPKQKQSDEFNDRSEIQFQSSSPTAN